MHFLNSIKRNAIQVVARIVVGHLDDLTKAAMEVVVTEVETEMDSVLQVLAVTVVTKLVISQEMYENFFTFFSKNFRILNTFYTFLSAKKQTNDAIAVISLVT